MASATPSVASALPDIATLDSRDCRTVVAGYLAFLGQGDYAVAALFWTADTHDAASLFAAFGHESRPRVKIDELTEEGAAGSLYCTAQLAMADGRSGDIVLKRVNDVDGATPQQLRWTIRSSTLSPVLAH